MVWSDSAGRQFYLQSASVPLEDSALQRQTEAVNAEPENCWDIPLLQKIAADMQQNRFSAVISMLSMDEDQKVAAGAGPAYLQR